MRDPGSPRRNPLFAARGPDEEARDSREARDVPLGATGARLGDDTPLAVAALLHALQEAGPEAAEHLMAAAHELVLAVKVVVDATERALAEQRAPQPERGAQERPPAPRRARHPSKVRRIDLA